MQKQRVYAVKLNHSCDNTLLINVYMPCDNRCVNNVNSEFTDTIDEIECRMNVSETRVILCGDWNCDFSRNTAQVKYLLDFIERQKLHTAWSNINAVPDFTYINDSLDNRSCIDHCIVSENVYNTIDKMYVSPNGINLSKHAPIVMILRGSIDQLRDQTTHRAPIILQKVAWHKVNDEHVTQYKACLNDKLNTIQLPNDVLLYKDVLCDNAHHIILLDKLRKYLIMTCIDASNEVMPQSQSKNHALPYRNELLEPYKEKSLFWHWIWIDSGKPHAGAIDQVMTSARARYHKTVKDVKKMNVNLKEG